MQLGICDQSNFVGTQGSRSFERQMARDPILLENNIYRALFHNCWNYLILKKLFVTLTCKVFCYKERSNNTSRPYTSQDVKFGFVRPQNSV